MALYNSEAINGFPTGNLSLALLNKISPNDVQFVSQMNVFRLPGRSFFGYFQTPYNDFNQAIEAVRQGHYWGVASIRLNFSQAVINKYVLLLF